MCWGPEPHHLPAPRGLLFFSQSLTESGTTTHSQDNSQLNVRRKRRHSQKRMTAEEAMVIRRTRSGRPFRQAAAAARQLLTTDETPVQQAVSQPHTHAATIMAQPLSSNVTDMTHQPQQSPVPAGHQHIAQPQVCARPAEEHQASVSLRRVSHSFAGAVGFSVRQPPRCPSGKASASRAEDPGFESCLRWDFFGVKSYQWLKNWHSSGYPARCLAL